MANEDVKKFIKQAERQGWRVDYRKGGHIMLSAPDGKGRVLLASTPSGHRWRRDAVARMRRHGFEDR